MAFRMQRPFRSFGYGGIGDPNTYGGMHFIGDPNTFGSMQYRTGANPYARMIGDPNTFGGIGDPNTFFGDSRGIIIYGRDVYGRTYFKGGWGWDPARGWFWHGTK